LTKAIFRSKNGGLCKLITHEKIEVKNTKILTQVPVEQAAGLLESVFESKAGMNYEIIVK
jgi:hypothetical protein